MDSTDVCFIITTKYNMTLWLFQVKFPVFLVLLFYDVSNVVAPDAG